MLGTGPTSFGQKIATLHLGFSRYNQNFGGHIDAFGVCRLRHDRLSLCRPDAFFRHLLRKPAIQNVSATTATVTFVRLQIRAPTRAAGAEDRADHDANLGLGGHGLAGLFSFQAASHMLAACRAISSP